MAIIITGRLVGAEKRDAVPATVVNGETRKAREAAVILSILDVKEVSKDQKLRDVVAPVELLPAYQAMLDEQIAIQVNDSLYSDQRGNGRASYKFVADVTK